MINCKDCTSENTLRMLYLYFVSLLELELTNNISIQFVYIIEILYNENTRHYVERGRVILHDLLSHLYLLMHCTENIDIVVTCRVATTL